MNVKNTVSGGGPLSLAGSAQHVASTCGAPQAASDPSIPMGSFCIKLDPSQELIALGSCNIAVSCLRGASRRTIHAQNATAAIYPISIKCFSLGNPNGPFRKLVLAGYSIIGGIFQAMSHK